MVFIAVVQDFMLTFSRIDEPLYRKQIISGNRVGIITKLKQ